MRTALASILAATPALAGLSVGTIGPWPYPDDTPACGFLDKDGTFYMQQAHALYGANDSRAWKFFSGASFDELKPHAALNGAVNASEPRDSNADTTFRCNVLSPTGREATRSTKPKSRYSEANYCDLAGTWVDPDTGDWIGLVHNEFTPEPFGDGLHMDSIDRAVSRDQGRTWEITEHVLTSPFSTGRNDTAAFPHDTYYYGNGDPRITFDLASGYVYVFYNSRVVDKGGSWKLFYAHVARAPIASKLRDFKKYHDGKWEEPGLGGRESVLVPTSVNPRGYASNTYDPTVPGKADELVRAKKAPGTTPLFVIDVAWNAFAGRWVGEPQSPAEDPTPQQFYACADLAQQKWELLGDTGSSYVTSSWYRWFVDAVSATGGGIVGRTWRSYCSFYCHAGKNGDYATVSLGEADGVKPIEGTLAGYAVQSTGDGAYTLRKEGKALGVQERKWGSPAALTDAEPGAKEQWWLIAAGEEGSFRAVNRWSGLVLTADGKTVPARHWDHGEQRAADQVLKLA